MPIVAITVATIVWFVVASALFFNPIVGKIYSNQEKMPGVRSLPKSPKTIVLLLCAILAQVALWAGVYALINSALPGDKLEKGLIFGLILVAIKMIPRDVDRILLSTYPKKRLLIEFIIGTISMFVVGVVFSYFN